MIYNFLIIYSKMYYIVKTLKAGVKDNILMITFLTEKNI